MSELIISISGIRGLVGGSLTPWEAMGLATAFAQIAPPGPILVASDGRTSGGALGAACIAGLSACGRKAVDLGVATTPTTEMAVDDRKAGGAIIVTASHNPAEWNGLKFLDPQGIFIRKDTLAELVALWRAERPSWQRWEAVPPPEAWHGAAEMHVERVLALDAVDVAQCRRAGLPVVLDTISASGGAVAPLVLERLGCRVTAVNAEITGRFEREPEPIPENIAAVGEVVRQSAAAVGLVMDPDGDRLALLDERGVPIGEEYTLALAVYAMRRRQPGGPVVVNVSTSRMIDDLGKELGFDVYRTPVGEINVVEGMIERGADLGGEGNGGVIFGDLHFGRDGVLGIALIVDLLAREGCALSEIVSRIPQYAIVKRKMELEKSATPRLLSSLEASAAERGADLDTCDGAKLIWSDRWLHVRPSNTEPVVRVIAEAPTEAEAVSLCDSARSDAET